MEVMLDALKIDKVFLNFVKHDDSMPEKQRIVAEIGIYLDPWEAARLGGDILSGKLAALARKERKRVAAEQEKMSGAKKTIYPRHIWDSRSGVSATKLASWGKDRKDGMSLSKWFKVSPGLKAAWVISAESGPGEETGKGIIEPRYKAPENIIRIPMSDETASKNSANLRCDTLCLCSRKSPYGSKCKHWNRQKRGLRKQVLLRWDFPSMKYLYQNKEGGGKNCAKDYGDRASPAKLFSFDMAIKI